MEKHGGIMELEYQDELKRVLSKDLVQTAGRLSKLEIRSLVRLYYQIQDFRKEAGLQSRDLEKAHEPHNVIDGVFDAMRFIESRIQKSLDVYTDKEPTGMGVWAKGIYAVGPVISAGLLAHIDISKVKSVGGIWRFAGLDPTVKWRKGEKRPWNAALKTLCWKIGESFVKFSGNEKCFYGKLWRERKEKETEANERGEYAEIAKTILEEKNFGKDTEAYKSYIQGKLPPGHIHARAKRWTVKVFLYHWYAEAYRRETGKEAPMPYVIAQLGHVGFIKAPEGATEED